MGGDEYLKHFKNRGETFPSEAEEALEALFNRLINRGTDPLEYFDSLRSLIESIRSESEAMGAFMASSERA